ncbi:hypothetical protein [Microbacterium testaceum]|uniref:hypothetical protein n=1 Tax=Microbacterium testaceum TaxID=2033 RepID=UPI001245141A|nr:hypothetical protein [Microbacterium testaceum]
MAQENARLFLLDLVDRVAATDRPFWEMAPQDRTALAALLGTPATAVRVLHDDDGEVRVEGAADLFLATAILAELAMQLAQEGGSARSREDAASLLRQRTRALLD